MQTKIITCNCEHKYQDAKYGNKKRVGNYARNANNKTGGYRCSVCGKIHPK